MKCSRSPTAISTVSWPRVRTTNFHGFTTKLSYTYGHSLDDLSYARHIIPQNSYCLQCDYGNSDFDIRNSFSMFLTLSVPSAD